MKTHLTYDVISFQEADDSNDMAAAKNADGDPEGLFTLGTQPLKVNFPDGI